ncbi:MAG TPA: T9SS type A sorting domain-containing protein [Bacteroidia bacterium]|jgi:hypothetical protein
MRHFLISLLLVEALNVSSQTYFTIAIAQDTLVVTQGQSAIFNVSGTPYLGFSSSLFFSATTEPCNLNTTFSPAVLNAPYSNSDLVITNTASIRPDTFDIVVKAENGVYSAYDTCVLIVVYDPAIKWAFFNPVNSALSYPNVTAIAQDKRNNDMWIAQSDGAVSALSRFNGFSWETFNSAGNHFISDMCGNSIYNVMSAPIVGPLISSLYVDSTKIWIGSSDGIKCFDRVSNTLIIDTVAAANPFVRIVKDNNGNMWFARYHGDLWKYNGSSWTSYNASNSPFNSLVTIAMDHQQNRLWVGTDGGGLHSFDGIFWTVYNSSNSPIPGNYVHRMSANPDGEAVVSGGAQGNDVLYKFDGVNITNLVNTVGPGFPLQVDTSTILLGRINSSQFGLTAFVDTSIFTVIPANFGVPVIDFTTTLVRDMTVDRLNNIWIATEHGLVVHNSAGLESVFNSPREYYSPVSVPEQSSGYDKTVNFLYPNPSSGLVKMALSLKSIMPLTVTLVDSRGILLKTWNVNSVSGYEEHSFDLSGYAAGLYYFTVTSDSFRRSQKLILAK